MNNDPHKMKNDVMASIMSNPKLAKTFREAMAAPIGSTKRAQAKAMLSIMNKVSPDGQGGIIGDAWNSVSNFFSPKPAAPSVPSTPTPLAQQNFSNLMIFPAAPAFKTPQMSVAPKPAINMSVAPKTPTPQPETPNFFDTAWNTIKGVGNYALNNAINVPGGIGLEPLTKYNEFKKATTPTPPMSVAPKEIGAIHAARDYIKGNAPLVPAAALGSVYGLGSAVQGGIQYALQNAYQGATDIWNFAVDPDQRIPKSAQPGYTSFGSTEGSKNFSNLINAVNPSAPSVQGSPAIETAKDALFNPANYAKGPDTSSSTPTNLIYNPDMLKVTGISQEEWNKMDTTNKNNVLNDYQTKAGINLNPESSTYGQPIGKNTSSEGNLAAANIAKLLGVSSDISLNNLSALDIARAIPVVEGYVNGTSTIARKNNNPGNLKYAGQAGATQDAKGFAVFQTPQDGAKALLNDIQHKMESGKYETLNDLMSVYSPNSDNPGYTGGTDFASTAAGASSSGLGATGTALDYADRVFGGGLDSYMINLDEKLRTDYKLPELETELSNLKNQGATLIPTLKTYMNGRDQYLKAIDAMIQKTEDNFSSMNLADPNAINSYNRQLTYLYTLKGKQEGRYQNFLNAAIGDYNADLTRVQGAYDSAKSAYTAALTSGGTMAQNQYNNIVTKMTSAINELDPVTIQTKAANLAILNKQLGISSLGTIENGLNGGIISPEYISNVDKFTKFITVGGTGADKDAIDFAKLPQNGLIGLYSQAALVGGEDPGLMMATSEAIRRSLKATLDASPGDPVVATKVKKLLTDLANDPRGIEYAKAISNTIADSTGSSFSSYIEKNISAVETAINDLIQGGSGFLWTGLGARKSGLKDKAGWLASHSSLDKDLLEGLYNMVSKGITPGSDLEKDPTLIIKRLLPSGATAKEKADLIAAGLS